MDVEARFADRASSRYMVLPLGYEGTTTFGKGCDQGPDAIITASQQVELFDEQYLDEFYEAGVHTCKPVDFSGVTPEQAQESIYQAAAPLMREGKFVLGLGGEHSISAALVRAAKEVWPGLCVLHFDAHADLRDHYQGSKFSHACVMRRIYELGVPFVSVGIRSFDREQHEFMRERNLHPITPARLAADRAGSIRQILEALSGPVYLTFDIDALDPALAPGTGTPEPGGLSYYEVLAILTAVGQAQKIIGADMVEVMPLAGSVVTEFLAARLAYKIIAASQLQRA